MAERKGLLVTFEGIDGSGKSTHLRLLAGWLQAKGLAFKSYAEPGGTVLGEKIRDILLKSGDPVAIRTEALLFLAARSELVATVLLPALADGAVILLDRFTDSTLAYQGWGRGIEIENLTRLAYFAAHGLVPDLTFFLDIAPEDAARRCRRPHKTQDRFETAGVEFYTRIREGYLALAQIHQERFKVLDSSLPIEAVSNQIIEATHAKLIETGYPVE